MKSPAIAWRNFLARADSFNLWLFVWLAALAVPLAGWPWAAGTALAGWLSVGLLAPGRHHGRRLALMAALFLLFWGLTLLLIDCFSSSFRFRPILNLAAWLALGLNLMLAKTPLALTLPLSRRLAPVIGGNRAGKLALALTLLVRLIPGLLSSALDLKRTIDRRAPQLSFRRRLALWGRTLVRLSLSQTDDLARTLLKRWPW